MWKTLQDSPPFYITFNEDSGIEILITDYINIWNVNFTRESFLSRLKERNDLVFENDDEFIQQGTFMFAHPDKLKKLNIIKEDDDKTLFVSMDVSFEYIITFECKLTKGTEEFFYERVTKQLLRIIQDLRLSQKKLTTMVKHKDKVLKTLKNKGVVLTARRFKTNSFNEEDHKKNHKEYEATFGTDEVLENVLTKIKTPNKNETADTSPTVKNEPPTIKTEPETSTDNAVNMSNVAVKEEVKQEVNTNPPSRENFVRKRTKKLNI